MRTEVNKFDDFTKIYSLFTEENKTTIFEMAKSLLKIQRKGPVGCSKEFRSPGKTEKEAGKNDQ